ATSFRNQSLLDNSPMDTGLILFIVAAAAALCLFVAGVFVLAGVGWSLIAGACSFLATAGFIRKGLTSE
ncbi:MULTISPECIES: hypothetical protein, partial [unclassified Pseudomonas]|uniref:hypothetical protein n=2 Tax=unclassified Pseudomonas TaxID=196821 RepID=UPI000C86B0DE